MQWGLRSLLNSRFSCIDLVKSHGNVATTCDIARFGHPQKDRLHVNDHFLDGFATETH